MSRARPAAASAWAAARRRSVSRAQQRHVAIGDDAPGSIVPPGRAGHQGRVAGAQRLRLVGELRPLAQQRGTPSSPGAMTTTGGPVRYGLRRGEDMRDHGRAAHGMEDFLLARVHPGAVARGKQDNGQAHFAILNKKGAQRSVPTNARLGRQDSNLRMADSKSAALPLGDAPLRDGYGITARDHSQRRDAAGQPLRRRL